MATEAPAPASARMTSRPMPEVEPVTRATLEASIFARSLFGEVDELTRSKNVFDYDKPDRNASTPSFECKGYKQKMFKSINSF